MASRSEGSAADLAAARDRMVARDIENRGVQDALVLAAMRKVPREAFVSGELREFAYDDSPLPIGSGQTISQPYIVAFMIEALQLKGGERVLEIGTGSGYAAAVLSLIAGSVYSVERLKSLAEQAGASLGAQGYANVHVLQGDGTLGWPEHAPYDAIGRRSAGAGVSEAAACDRGPAGDPGGCQRGRAAIGTGGQIVRDRVCPGGYLQRPLRPSDRRAGLVGRAGGACAAFRRHAKLDHDLRANVFGVCREGKPVSTFPDHAPAFYSNAFS